MLKSKKLFAVMFLSAGLFFLLTGTQKAQAQGSLFFSTLSKIPGYKIVKDYGFVAIRHHNSNEVQSNKVLITDIIGQPPVVKWLFFSSTTTAMFTYINQYKPSGANACINLKFSKGIYSTCEYVKLVPKNK